MEPPATAAPSKPTLPGAFALFKPSSNAVMLNIGTFLALFLVPFAIFIVLFVVLTGFRVGLLSGGGGSTAVNMFSLLLGLAGVIIALLMAPALPYVQLVSAKGQKTSFGEAWRHGLKFAGRFYGLSILVGLIIFAGLILFIVPGLIFYRRYALAQYYMYDRNLGINEAMKQSAAASKPVAGAIWGVIGVQSLFGLIGIVPLIGGLIGAVLQALYSCALPLRYLQISGLPTAPAAPVPATGAPPSPVQ